VLGDGEGILVFGFKGMTKDQIQQILDFTKRVTGSKSKPVRILQGPFRFHLREGRPARGVPMQSRALIALEA
jgi:hypothetical protein